MKVSADVSSGVRVVVLQKAGIPHTTQSVEELFNLVDIDGSSIMEWSEFETFVANEIQEGRDFMEGEFVLPSGAGIQFAAMVDALRRKSRVQAVMQVLHVCQGMFQTWSCWAATQQCLFAT